MKILIYTLTILIAFPVPVMAQETYVPGYYRNDGTYVQPHYRSAPNNNPYDNWSSQGNVNPHTGQNGTQNRNPNGPAYNTNGGRGSSYKPGSEGGMGIVFGR